MTIFNTGAVASQYSTATQSLSNLQTTAISPINSNGIPLVDPGQYAAATVVHGNTLVGTTWVALLAANPLARFRMIQNGSTSAILWVRLDGIAPAVNTGFFILPQQAWWFPSNVSLDLPINIVSDTANTPVNYMEIT